MMQLVYILKERQQFRDSTLENFILGYSKKHWHLKGINP